MNYEFYYYCFFYLSFFEEQRARCVNRRTGKRHKYFEISFDDYIDTEILELFFLTNEIILAVDFSLKR